MFNQIETERLIIRKFKADDFMGLYAYLSDENVVKYEPYEPYTVAQAQREAEFRANSDEFFAVTLKSGRLIGNLYLGKREFRSMELGFVFAAEGQGQGFATESAPSLLNYAFDELGTHRVVAECNPLNMRSWRLMERLGMRREGEFRQNVYFRKDSGGNPLWQDTYQYAILADEWKNRQRFGGEFYDTTG